MPCRTNPPTTAAPAALDGLPRRAPLARQRERWRRAEGDRVRLEVADWLRGFRWAWWVTLTCAAEWSPNRMAEATHRWVRRLSPAAYTVLAIERGTAGGRVHGHALLGGLPRDPATGRALERRWSHGRVTVAPYRPRWDRPTSRTGASYYLAAGWTDSDLAGRPAVELIGHPVPWRPRKGRRS